MQQPICSSKSGTSSGTLNLNRNSVKRHLMLVLMVLFMCQGFALAQNVRVYDDVAPILNERCIMCHSGANPPLGLRLDAYDAILEGSQNGPVVLPSDTENSELIKRIRGESLPRMPLTGPPYLSEEDIDTIVAWVAAGFQETQDASTTTGSPTVSTPSKVTPPSPREILEAVESITFTQVAPIFNNRCVKCHTTSGLMGPAPEGYNLSSYPAILSTEERARVVPSNPDASELVRRIDGRSLPRMPFDGPPYLSSDEIDLIVAWIKQGAQDENGTTAPIPIGTRVRFEGILTARWALDGMPLIVSSETRIDKKPNVGDHVEVRAIIAQDGSLRVTRLRRR